MVQYLDRVEQLYAMQIFRNCLGQYSTIQLTIWQVSRELYLSFYNYYVLPPHYNMLL